jgi:hypothetical protein
MKTITAKVGQQWVSKVAILFTDAIVYLEYHHPESFASIQVQTNKAKKLTRAPERI